MTAKFAWDITPWVKATFITGFWSNEANSTVQTYLRDRAGNPTYGGVSGFASNYYTLSEKHLANAISIKSDTKGTFDFDLAASRYDYLEDIQRNPFTVGAGASFSANGKITRMDGTNWTTGDAKAIWRPNEVHEFSFGLHADRYNLNNPVYAPPSWNFGPASTSSLYSNSIGTTRTVALWLQDAWRVVPDWKLTLGGRLEDWQASNCFNLQTVSNGAGVIDPARTKMVFQPELDATRFSPKASLSWEPSTQWQVTASVGQAYRFPTVAELYQSVSSATQVVIPDPNLRPENGLSEEIAVERRFADSNVRLSFFNENIHDALISQTTVSGSTLVTAFSNVDAVRNRGIELSARKDNVMISGLELFGSVTYVDSRIQSDPNFVSTTGTSAIGKHVPNIPDWRATLGRPIGRMRIGRLPRRQGTAESSIPRWTIPISFRTCSEPSIASPWWICARSTDSPKLQPRISASIMSATPNTPCSTRSPAEPISPM